MPNDLAEYRERTRKRYTLWTRLRSQWVTVLAASGGIVGFGRYVVGLFTGSTQNAVFYESLVLVIFGLVLLGVSLLLYCRSLSRTRHAWAIEFVHAAIHILRDETVRQASGRDPQRERQAIREALSAVRNAFTIILGRSCRATLKAISDKPDQYSPVDKKTLEAIDAGGFVVTYARDTITHQLMVNAPDQGIAIKDNPRFDEFLVHPHERCVVIKDTTDTADRMTQNTSRIKYGGPLPYLSEIVWPLRAMGSGKVDANLFGFLVVDCYKKCAFQKACYFDLGAAFADALYMFFASLYLPKSEVGEQVLDAKQTPAVSRIQ